MEEKVGRSSGAGPFQWRKRGQLNRRRLNKAVKTETPSTTESTTDQTAEQTPCKEESPALSGRTYRSSTHTTETSSIHTLDHSYILKSHDFTHFGAPSTEGTSFPVATTTDFPVTSTTAQLLLMEMLSSETEASYQISKHEFEELGCMQFHFVSFHDATNYCRTTRRPVLLVQAEIPGDTEAGNEIFSHPLIVEAADSLFTTVFNKGENYSCSASRSASGKSRRTRVGFFDELGNEIVPSLSADLLTRAGMAEAMIATLEACEQPVPKYLKILYDEERGRINTGPVGLPVSCYYRAVFGMNDSTLGEVEFAGLDGVISTRAGFLACQKIVQVIYDPVRLSFGAVINYALKRKVGDIIYYQTNDERMVAMMQIQRLKENSKLTEFLGTIQLDYDPKRALRKSPLRYVPLTDLQATRANRLVHLDRFDEAMHLLSPRQGLIFMQARKTTAQKFFKDVIDVPILPAWMSVCGIQHVDAPTAEEEADPADSSSDDSD
jgi:hypothetical protein